MWDGLKLCKTKVWPNGFKLNFIWVLQPKKSNKTYVWSWLNGRTKSLISWCDPWLHLEINTPWATCYFLNTPYTSYPHTCVHTIFSPSSGMPFSIISVYFNSFLLNSYHVHQVFPYPSNLMCFIPLQFFACSLWHISFCLVTSACFLGENSATKLSVLG